jgi:3-methyl-2-oxobutanoate hydroxymethyltransferase
MLSHAHHAKVSPRFCKPYAQVGDVIQNALNTYKQEVEQRLFPTMQYSPYQVEKNERAEFEDLLYEQLRKEGIKLKPAPVSGAATAADEDKNKTANPTKSTDEETIKLY